MLIRDKSLIKKLPLNITQIVYKTLFSTSSSLVVKFNSVYFLESFTMAPTLYHFPLSAGSRGAVLSARLVGVPVQVKIIDLFKKEQLSEVFIQINPQHTVPTLDDEGFVVWESRAIACYLADKYGANKDFYPKDLQKRAIVDQRLYFDSTFLYPRFRAICFPIIYEGVTEINEKLKNDLNASLGFLNKFLEGKHWVADNNLTIADTAILSTVSTIVEIGWDLSPFPNIQRWLNNCQSIPGYEENLDGARKYGALVKKNLK